MAPESVDYRKLLEFQLEDLRNDLQAVRNEMREKEAKIEAETKRLSAQIDRWSWFFGFLGRLAIWIGGVTTGVWALRDFLTKFVKVFAQ